MPRIKQNRGHQNSILVVLEVVVCGVTTVNNKSYRDISIHFVLLYNWMT